MVDLANNVWRDFATAGIPASGKKKPEKSKIREWGTYLESLTMAASYGNTIWKATSTLLGADIAHADGVPAIVYADTTAADNGIYIKSGASGAGSWSQIITYLPGYQFVTAFDAGAGTANAIVATSSPRVTYTDGAQLIRLNIYEANTSTTVTVAFDGGAALTIQTSAGNSPAIGGLAAGMTILGVVDQVGTVFRMLSDQTSAAIQAAAEAAQTAAEAAQAAAEAAASSVTSLVSTIAQAQAATPAVDPTYYNVAFRTSEQVAHSGATYKKVASAPAHAGKFQNGNGTWYELMPGSGGTIHGEVFGLVFDSLTASATANSTAVQNAADYMASIGGGTLLFGAGTAYLDAVPIIPASVNTIGSDIYYTIFKKFGSTASTETTTLQPDWAGAPIGYPVCVMQYGHIGGTNWSGRCENITFLGDTASPNTTTTVFGVFVSGASNGHFRNCFANYVQNAFFFGAGAMIYSSVIGCVAGNCWRGFYDHFSTSTTFANNFVANARYLGYRRSCYYSSTYGNACDSGGTTWKVGTTEIFLAYRFSGCRGGSAFDNGAESCNGSVWEVVSCISFSLHGNVAMEIVSNYTGAGFIAGLHLNQNIDCSYYDNKAELETPTGTAGLHYNWYVTTAEYGDYQFQRNHFYNAWNETGADTGWANTTSNLRTQNGSFTGTLTGCTTSPTGTIDWSYSGGVVTLEIPGISGTSNTTAATITGMPSVLSPTATQTFWTAVYENTAAVMAIAQVETNGTISIYASLAAAGFTASGTKGIRPVTLSYRIF